jgi:hypothetical protein
VRALRLPSFAYPYQMVIWSSFVSNTGTTFYRMAAAIVAFRLTGQVAAAGGAYLFSLLPRLILLPIGGGDRRSRRPAGSAHPAGPSLRCRRWSHSTGDLLAVAAVHVHLWIRPHVTELHL